MKVSRATDCYVVIEPSTRFWPRFQSHDDYINKKKRECRDIIDQVKRHVDGVESARVVVEREDVCPNCDGKWTEDSEHYNGGCCGYDLRFCYLVEFFVSAGLIFGATECSI